MCKVKRITTKTVKPKMLTKDSNLKAVSLLKICGAERIRNADVSRVTFERMKVTLYEMFWFEDER
jgi:hypothetical protein